MKPVVLSNRLYNRFDNRLYTRYSRLSNRLSNGFDNRLNVCIHVWQQVVSCKRGLRINLPNTGWRRKRNGPLFTESWRRQCTLASNCFTITVSSNILMKLLLNVRSHDTLKRVATLPCETLCVSWLAMANDQGFFAPACTTCYVYWRPRRLRDVILRSKCNNTKPTTFAAVGCTPDRGVPSV